MLNGNPISSSTSLGGPVRLFLDVLFKTSLKKLLEKVPNTNYRVYDMIEFSNERGGMCNLAYIGVTVLNFGLAWLAVRTVQNF